MKIKQARLTTEELHELKWLTGGLLCLLSFWSLWALDLRAEGILALGSALIALALLKPAWVTSIPEYTWKMVGPAILLIIVADFVLSAPDFLPPLVRMVVWLLLYRALAPRGRREDLQLVLLCLFCLVISGALTVSLLFAFQILLFAPLAMAMLFVICLLDRGNLGAPVESSWQNFKLGHLLRRLWQVLDIKIMGLTALLFCFVVAVSTLLFVLMPRFNWDHNIPFLKLSSQAVAEFSENVQLGQVTDITLDNSVALRIDVPSLEAIDPAPYWRMLILDKYENGNFSLSDELKQASEGLEEARRLDGWGLSMSDHRSGHWDFYLEGNTSRYLPMPGPHRGIRFDETQKVHVSELLYLVKLESVRQKTMSYRVEDLDWARRFPAWPTEIAAFAAAQGVHPDALKQVEAKLLQQDREGPADLESAGGIGRHTYGPPGIEAPGLRYPLSALELAISERERIYLGSVNSAIFEETPIENALDFSWRVTDYLRQNFTYSLQPDGGGAAGDPVVRWLQTGTRGYCELFAGAFILLAREAGFPARMVTGFAGGGWNPVQDFFVVRNRDAHAWVEIYHESTREWIRVDPTPGAGGSHPDAPPVRSFEAETGWGTWVDSLRIQWYRRIVNFEQDDQIEMADSVVGRIRKLSADVGARVRGFFERVGEWMAQPFSAANLFQAGVVLLFVLALFFGWRGRYILLGFFFLLLKRPDGLDPVRHQSAYFLKRFRPRIVQAERAGRDSGALVEMSRTLKALRFGPPVELSTARPIFKAARRVLRKK